MYYKEGVKESNHVEPRGPQMISVIDCDLVEEDVWEECEQVDMMAIKFVHGNPIYSPYFDAFQR